MLNTTKRMPALNNIPQVYKSRGLVRGPPQPFNVLPAPIVLTSPTITNVTTTSTTATVSFIVSSVGAANYTLTVNGLIVNSNVSPIVITGLSPASSYSAVVTANAIPGGRYHSSTGSPYSFNTNLDTPLPTNYQTSSSGTNVSIYFQTLNTQNVSYRITYVREDLIAFYYPDPPPITVVNTNTSPLTISSGLNTIHPIYIFTIQAVDTTSTYPSSQIYQFKIILYTSTFSITAVNAKDTHVYLTPTVMTLDSQSYLNIQHDTLIATSVEYGVTTSKSYGGNITIDLTGIPAATSQHAYLTFHDSRNIYLDMKSGTSSFKTAYLQSQVTNYVSHNDSIDVYFTPSTPGYIYGVIATDHSFSFTGGNPIAVTGLSISTIYSCLFTSGKANDTSFNASISDPFNIATNLASPSISLVSFTDTSAVVSFTTVSHASIYNILLNTNLFTSTNTSPVTITGLTQNTLYSIGIVAHDTSNIYGDSDENAVNVNTSLFLSVVNKIISKQGGLFDIYVTSSPNIVSYTLIVTYPDTTTHSYTSSTNVFTNIALAYATSYSFQVNTSDGQGNAQGNITSLKSGLSTPSYTKCYPDSTSLIIYFNTIQHSNRYKLKYKNTVIYATSSPVTISNLVSGTLYNVELTAQDTTNTYPDSATVSYNFGTYPTYSPYILNITPTNNSGLIYFNTLPNVSSYTLFLTNPSVSFILRKLVGNPTIVSSSDVILQGSSDYVQSKESFSTINNDVYFSFNVAHLTSLYTGNYVNVGLITYGDTYYFQIRLNSYGIPEYSTDNGTTFRAAGSYNSNFVIYVISTHIYWKVDDNIVFDMNVTHTNYTDWLIDIPMVTYSTGYIEINNINIKSVTNETITSSPVSVLSLSPASTYNPYIVASDTIQIYGPTSSFTTTLDIPSITSYVIGKNIGYDISFNTVSYANLYFIRCDSYGFYGPTSPINTQSLPFGTYNAYITAKDTTKTFLDSAESSNPFILTIPKPYSPPAPPQLEIQDFYTFGSGFAFSVYTIGGHPNPNYPAATYNTYIFYNGSQSITSNIGNFQRFDYKNNLIYFNTSTVFFTPVKGTVYSVHCEGVDSYGDLQTIVGPSRSVVSNIDNPFPDQFVTVIDSNNISINLVTLPSGDNVLPVTSYNIQIYQDSPFMQVYSQDFTTSQVINVGSLLSGTTYYLYLILKTPFTNYDPLTQTNIVVSLQVHFEVFNTP